jgi:hypothetical protein
LRQRIKTAQPPLGTNADRIEYAGADVAAHEKAYQEGRAVATKTDSGT